MNILRVCMHLCVSMYIPMIMEAGEEAMVEHGLSPFQHRSSYLR